MLRAGYPTPTPTWEGEVGFFPRLKISKECWLTPLTLKKKIFLKPKLKQKTKIFPYIHLLIISIWRIWLLCTSQCHEGGTLFSGAGWRRRQITEAEKVPATRWGPAAGLQLTTKYEDIKNLNFFCSIKQPNPMA